MTSHKLNNDEVTTLFNLRANTVWGYKECFGSNGTSSCQLKCGTGTDSLEHIFNCPIIGKYQNQPRNILLQNVYSDIKLQKETVTNFLSINNVRTSLLEVEECKQTHARSQAVQESNV